MREQVQEDSGTAASAYQEGRQPRAITQPQHWRDWPLRAGAGDGIRFHGLVLAVQGIARSHKLYTNNFK